MRRFYLHRRGEIWYAELVDAVSGTKLPAKSTGKDIRDEALMVVMGWLENGLPVRSAAGNRAAVSPDSDGVGLVSPVPGRTRAVSDSLALASILATIRKTNLAIADAEKIGALLVEKNLFTSFIPKDSGASEPFDHFIGRFWDFERSPYVREKHAHGLRMGRTHAKLSAERAALYWVPYFRDRTIGEITR